MLKGKICVLDDQLQFLEKIKQNFDLNYKENHEAQLQITTSYEKALNLVKAKKIDTLVSDLRMPVFSGIEVLEKAYDLNKEINLILLTGELITENEQIRCKRIGASFLFKGEGFQNLLRNIFLLAAPEKKLKDSKIDYVFISYLSEDYSTVQRIVHELEQHGISCWIDRNKLTPGIDWQIAIRSAIESGGYFLACFSENYWSRNQNKSYMNEELNIALEQLRRMPEDKIWFIPIKLEECKIPHFSLNNRKTLEAKQFVNLKLDWNLGIKNIINTIKE